MRPAPCAIPAALLAAVLPAAAAPGEAPAVDIVVVGSAADFARVRELAQKTPDNGRDTFTRADTFEPAQILAPAPAGRVRCWVDLRGAGRARLYFSAASSDRFLVRDVELSGGFDEVGRAALAEVLDLSIEALLENDRAGLSRAEAETLLAPPPAPPPPPPAPRPSPLASAPSLTRQATHLEWGAFYAAQALSAEVAIAHGPGASVLLVRELEREETRRFLAGWLTAQYRLPERERAAQTGVRLDTLALRGGVELGRRRWAARLGVGADFVHVTPEAPAPAVTPAPAHWSTSLVLTTALRFSTRVSNHVRASALAVFDLLPVPVDYVVIVDGIETPIFSPLRLRPGLALELAFF
jgi:hypothetical protein